MQSSLPVIIKAVTAQQCRRRLIIRGLLVADMVGCLGWLYGTCIARVLGGTPLIFHEITQNRLIHLPLLSIIKESSKDPLVQLLVGVVVIVIIML